MSYLPRKLYSLENKIYPLTSMENEMERLFGVSVWHELKEKQNEEESSSPSSSETTTSDPQLSSAAEIVSVPQPSSSAEIVSVPQPSSSGEIVSIPQPLTKVDCKAAGGAIPKNPSSLSRKGFPSTYRTIARNLRKQKQVECKFCLRNGESPIIVRSHTLKDKNGNVVCPVLREFHCLLCGATGDAAHTRKYCPLYTKIDFNSQFSDNE